MEAEASQQHPTSLATTSRAVERALPLLPAEDLFLIVHFTRNWLHYGTMGFAVMCVFVGALRGILAS